MFIFLKLVTLEYWIDSMPQYYSSPTKMANTKAMFTVVSYRKAA